MTIRLDMRRAVTRAVEALGDSIDAVRQFLRQNLHDDGGFKGRDGQSDLYYTLFGLEASIALDARVPYDRVADYLAGFETGGSLDLVHLACLIRCKANLAHRMGGALDSAMREAFATRLMRFRAADGGFSTSAGADRGHVYGSFLALGACQDLEVDTLEPDRLLASVESLMMPDGGYANEPTMKASATPATAAALTIFHYLRQPIPDAAGRWLFARAAREGGFTAIPFPPDVAVPDLLSTATALHALSLTDTPLDDRLREANLDYLDVLWDARGGFHGHPDDDIVDCEYTYYGLLALGHLAGS
jgi:hypothetical protein